MKKSTLKKILNAHPENEVRVLIDGCEYDIAHDVDHLPESTNYPETLALRLIEIE